MPKPVIEIENLGKLYRIGSQKEKYLSLREEIVKKFSPGARRAHAAKEEFWALKDISFSVQQGAAVGIIGRNGAGKSTLLKILSQITPPTEGRITMHGRVASLLEVGTGFHGELTGRENIYLNGAILGMTRREITRKFDEIVAFAEVERFLDTPVKRYSSGMYVRLAFAVAAHLEPEILLVDEVLAVGDAEFQKKCLGKMGEVAKAGRTVLFVSHNMGAVRTLTNVCFYLNEGRIKSNGFTEQVVQQYFGEIYGYTKRGQTKLDLHHRDPIRQSPVWFTRVWIDDSEDEIPIIQMGQNFSIFMELETSIEICGAHLGFGIKKRDGCQVTTIISRDHGFTVFLSPGKHIVNAAIKNLPLTPGEYMVDVGINQSTETKSWDVVLDYPLFTVVDRTGEVVYWTGRPWGAIHWKDVTWSIQG